MSQFKQLCMSALEGANWEAPCDVVQACEETGPWLLEEHSMTERLRRYCKELRVEVFAQFPVDASQLTLQERSLLGDENCLVRQVIIYGDNQPWLCARTLMPQTTLTDNEKDIADLGDIPLGERVFRFGEARRDAIEVARVEMVPHALLARRSRLWVNNKPLLVAELFLPDAPVYAKER